MPSSTPAPSLSPKRIRTAFVLLSMPRRLKSSCASPRNLLSPTLKPSSTMRSRACPNPDGSSRERMHQIQNRPLFAELQSRIAGRSAQHFELHLAGGRDVDVGDHRVAV